MSLNAAERRATAAELAANLALAGATPDDVAADLRLDAARVRDALAMGPGANPVDVWAVRDSVERLAARAGATPVPFTILTEHARTLAAGWFGVEPR
jgi:hypothetical protein